MLTIELLLMNRITWGDLTPELQKNATKLIEAINLLLNELGVDKVQVSSGYRTPAANAAAHGAKNSLHMTCQACDLMDNKQQSLATLVASRPDLLRKHGLFLESPQHTIGQHTNWVHLDIGTRSDRPNRQFLP